jgi:FkbM family methyltransferase
MSLPDVLLDAGSSAVRTLAYLPGLWRFSELLTTFNRFFNASMLRLGAQPVVTAPMKDGTRMRVDLRANTELGAYYLGAYDLDLVAAICKLLPHRSVFLDVGANIGFYTVAVSNFCRSRQNPCRVVAFEPLDANYRRIIENVELNNLQSYCTIMRMGLSNKPGTNYLTLREDFQGGSNTGNAAIVIGDRCDAGFARIAIQTTCLDDIWDSSNIDVIKLDIEGHEDFFLEGARKTLAMCRPTILMEVNKYFYQARRVDMDARFAPLLPHNYRMYRRSSSGWSRISSLGDCATVDDVFLVPAEKFGSSGYEAFN